MSERNPPAGDLGWLPSAPATGFLLDRGQIERVEPNPAHARATLVRAWSGWALTYRRISSIALRW